MCHSRAVVSTAWTQHGDHGQRDAGEAQQQLEEQPEQEPTRSLPAQDAHAILDQGNR